MSGEQQARPGITDEMIEAAAALMTVRAWNKLDDEQKTFWLGEARKVLEAALTGRTVIDLPEPDGQDDGGPVWSMPGGASPVTLAVVDGEAFVSALGPADPVDFAETYALAVLAAVWHARGLAESSEGGEPPVTAISAKDWPTAGSSGNTLVVEGTDDTCGTVNLWIADRSGDGPGVLLDATQLREFAADLLARADLMEPTGELR